MATRPASTRKPSVNVPATGRTSTVPTKATAKAAPTKTTPANTAAPRKAPARRATTSVARKPVSAIVTKNLKPVIAKTVTAAVKTQPASKPVKAKIDPPKKVKLVRATFSFPDHEHALLIDLKKRAKKLGQEFKKSEILRAGIAHLVALADAALVTTLAKVERVKTGRPAKKGKKK